MEMVAGTSETVYVLNSSSLITKDVHGSILVGFGQNQNHIEYNGLGEVK